MMRSSILLALCIAFAGASLACSGSSSAPTETGSSSAELTSSFADRVVQSTRAADGTVHATLADRDGVAAKLTVGADGEGVLENLRDASTGAFATQSSADLAAVNRSFDRAWLQATAASADGVPYRICGNWSSSSREYCASRGQSDCARSCGGRMWQFYGSYGQASPRREATYCMCGCDDCP